MPRAPKISKTKTEEKSVFQMIIGVTIVALLSGINMFFFDSPLQSSPKVSAYVSGSIDTAAPKAPVALPLPEDQARVVLDPTNRVPQCDFRSNVKNIIYGQPVKFYWDCANADKCSLDGAGEVAVSNREGVEVSPKRSAKYQLVCSNNEGSRSFGIDIGVFEFSLRELNSVK